MFLFANEQIILVVADEFNSTKAKLLCFENNRAIFAPIEVNLGALGVAFGAGEIEFLKTDADPIKKEGDKKAPLGIFTLESVFGYEKDMNIKMPYLHVTEELICVDDSNSKSYNQIIKKSSKLPASYEEMRREDAQYELGITVGHNKEQIPQMGSCIFIHVEKSKDAPTAGCTSMKLEDITKIVHWLDKSKNPILIQILSSQKRELAKLYPLLEI
ncbi:L,D-transpeptidase family protein [Sulfurimonas denitrificans]|nr:L,D-transpeptidase family protein [Sulfurimonas denitrificans]MDD3442173.1 L,D-transpeptidase family protein [Sulfurimonas denitrificans]